MRNVGDTEAKFTMEADKYVISCKRSAIEFLGLAFSIYSSRDLNCLKGYSYLVAVVNIREFPKGSNTAYVMMVLPFLLRPFSVSPATGTLEVGACIQITVTYEPRELRHHSGELRTLYSSGETVYTELYGSAKDVNVYLDRASIVFDDTYSGLSTQR